MPLEGLGVFILGVVVGIFIGWGLSEAVYRLGKNSQSAGSKAQKVRLETKDEQIKDLEDELEHMKAELRSYRKKVSAKTFVEEELEDTARMAEKKAKKKKSVDKQVICPACHKAVSAGLITCPYCGCSI